VFTLFLPQVSIPSPMHPPKENLLVCVCGLLALLVFCLPARAEAENWTPLFNGEEIEGDQVHSPHPAPPLGQWVSVEAEVRGDQLIRHIVNGEAMLEYTDLRKADGSPLKEGFIALQAETHPVQFRNIGILVLDEDRSVGQL